jgi:predicted CXXCH cytochrome family protein
VTSTHARIAALAAIPLLALAWLATSVVRIRRELATPVSLHDVAYTGSRSCVGCHPVHYRTWYTTFHRTMTQEATESAVLGDFNDTTLDYEGVRSRFTRDAAGTFTIDIGSSRFPIARTVGSRRVQQYLTKAGDHYLRLPLAWNIAERRWFHLNGGFLDPDGTPFDQHTALWDANCIFCHNVKANPSFDRSTRRFDSKVAELGIACEACHGPAARHVEANSSPLRRYLLHYGGHRDPTILSPLELPKERQVQLCGHCHGQRLPNPRSRIAEFMKSGDPYTAGDDLDEYTQPIDINTHVPGVDASLRFWKDGTPRLTAYEYQALRMSRDYQHGNLTCISCHTAHGGDPRGMITTAMRGSAACARCHDVIVRNAPAHTRHKANSSGSDCYACHMPKIVYGLLDVHPTHYIQRPDPSRAWRFEMPEACTLCHTNRTAAWAARSPSPNAPEFAIAENVRQLFGGDVVQRSVAVMALGAEASYTTDANARLWAVPLLLATMDEDNYASVRHFADRSLRALIARADVSVVAGSASLPKFDAQATPEVRRQTIAAWQAWWRAVDKHRIPHPGDAVPLDSSLQLRRDLIDPLRAKQNDRMIAIGE